jgi:hypothetical protein
MARPTASLADELAAGLQMTIDTERNHKLVKVRGALSDAIFNSAYFWQMATDERDVIQIFNVGAERMLGYDALDVVDRITPRTSPIRRSSSAARPSSARSWTLRSPLVSRLSSSRPNAASRTSTS